MDNYYESQWASDFGDKYTKRCQIDYKPRVPMFKKLLKGLEIESVLEVGANMGHNLVAINEARGADVFGIDINKYAIENALMPIEYGSAYKLPYDDDTFDLVYTAGVLIHIPPDKLKSAMKELYRVSKKYVLMIEYPADEERGRKYRDFGNKQGVWARPYGHLFQRLFENARLVKTGSMKDIGKDKWGFSKDCDYHIFSK